MACRIIKELSSEFIIKEIPLNFIGDDELWPHPHATTNSELYKLFVLYETNKIAQQAIMQQYNEIILYNKVDLYQKSLLAPQCDVRYIKPYNLPQIIYPKFKPLIKEEIVWSTSAEDLPILIGAELNKINIDFYQYKSFIKNISELCEDWNLREDDILLNPSNIGYHPILGLRIIDYGLTNDNNLVL